ncbi:MAG: hypothetical protein V3V62_15100 [bacterium]
MQGGDGRGSDYFMTREAAAWNLREVGHIDLAPGSDMFGGALKIQIQIVGGRRYMYAGCLWYQGVHVLDVTDPFEPEYITCLPAPYRTSRANIQQAGDLLISSEDSPYIGPAYLRHEGLPDWSEDRPSERSGVTIYDVSNPREPRELTYFHIPGGGTHRNYYDGGRWAYLTARVEGFAGYILVIVDLQNPEKPEEAGRFWLPGQGPGEERSWDPANLSEREGLHGPVYVMGDRGYASWGAAGMLVLDMADPPNPKLLGQLRLTPPFDGGIPCHTAFPMMDRGLAVITQEAIADNCEETQPLAWMADIRCDWNPVSISTFPIPKPPPGLPYATFCEKGGRFGPHNVQHMSGPGVQRDDLVFMSYFNAGLRVYDIRNPFRPEEIAYFVPPDPRPRLPVRAEDVYVEWDRGLIYLACRNMGIYILELEEGAMDGEPVDFE